MTEKRYSLRINAKDKGVKIFDNIDEDNWRVLNLHFNNYDDAQFVRSKLIPVVALLNDLSEENEQLKIRNKGKQAFIDKQDKIIRLLYNQCKDFKEILDDSNITYPIDERLNKFFEEGVKLWAI